MTSGRRIMMTENIDLDTEPILSPYFSGFKDFIVVNLMSHLYMKIGKFIIYIFLKSKNLFACL